MDGWMDGRMDGRRNGLVDGSGGGCMEMNLWMESFSLLKRDLDGAQYKFWLILVIYY